MTRVLFKLEIEAFADNAEELTHLVYEYFAWRTFKIEMLHE